jgi:hypothetical protein
VPASIAEACRAYETDQFAYTTLATGLAKVPAWLALRRSSAALDKALFKASAALLLPWLGQQAKARGVDLKETWSEEQRTFVATAILAGMGAPKYVGPATGHRDDPASSAGQPEPKASPRLAVASAPIDYAAMKALLGLRPDVAVAGVDRWPHDGAVGMIPMGDLRQAILDAEGAARALVAADAAAYASPEYAELCEVARTMRVALSAYAEHRAGQRDWRANKARHKKPRRVLSQTTLRTNRDPFSDGPQYA